MLNFGQNDDRMLWVVALPVEGVGVGGWRIGSGVGESEKAVSESESFDSVFVVVFFLVFNDVSGFTVPPMIVPCVAM